MHFTLLILRKAMTLEDTLQYRTNSSCFKIATPFGKNRNSTGKSRKQKRKSVFEVLEIIRAMELWDQELH